jgi:predicted nucleic acid-binding protein
MRLFVDTSAWLALNDRSDQYHQKALSRNAAIRSQRIELITSEYVVDESLTIIRYRVSLKAAVILGESLMNSRIVTVADVANEERLAAWALFKKYADKELSFTDCTSFALMNKLGLLQAFSFDDHFRQIGFELF